MKQIFTCAVVAAALSLSACSSWVYRLDIPQGNYLEQKDVDKLRVGMTKEQVNFLLGSPVAKNAFNSNVWHYVYVLNVGRGEDNRQELVLTFNNDQLVSMAGDFKQPEQFSTPLDQ